MPGLFGGKDVVTLYPVNQSNINQSVSPWLHDQEFQQSLQCFFCICWFADLFNLLCFILLYFSFVVFSDLLFVLNCCAVAENRTSVILLEINRIK